MAHTHMKDKYTQTITAASGGPDLISFWECLPVSKYPNLKRFAKRYICRFGTTYVCEQTFSSMNLIKNKHRTRLTDQHLGNLLRLGSTNMRPRIKELVMAKQIQKSR